MASPDGTHVAYNPNVLREENDDSPFKVASDEIAMFSSENAALRYAVRRRWAYIKVPYGMTLAEAIAAEKSILDAVKPVAAAVTRVRKPREDVVDEAGPDAAEVPFG